MSPRLWVAYIVVLVCAYEVNSACEENEFELDINICCTRCQPGYGAGQQCSVENDTACEPCANGKSFSPSLSHHEPCFTCSLCGKGAHVTSTCNVTHDTQCACDSLADSYITRDSLECNLCDLCPAGWGAFEACTPESNTRCKQCPNGTYSNVLSATDGCFNCTVCSTEQQMLQMCTATQDTICINLDLAIYKHNSRDSTQRYAERTPVKKQPAGEDNDIDIIPLYCAILGAVVIGLLGYVVLVHYRRMKEKRLVREPHEDVEYSKASGGDSGIYVEVEHHSKLAPAGIVTCSTKIRDLPQSTKRELEKCFLQSKDPSEWKLLAKQLGYNNKRITQIEVQAQRDTTAPIRQVIKEWGSGEKATVGLLIQALKNIGRADILRNLHITNPNELQPLNPHLQQHIL